MLLLGETRDKEVRVERVVVFFRSTAHAVGESRLLIAQTRPSAWKIRPMFSYFLPSRCARRFVRSMGLEVIRT